MDRWIKNNYKSIESIYDDVYCSILKKDNPDIQCQAFRNRLVSIEKNIISFIKKDKDFFSQLSFIESNFIKINIKGNKKDKGYYNKWYIFFVLPLVEQYNDAVMDKVIKIVNKKTKKINIITDEKINNILRNLIININLLLEEDYEEMKNYVEWLKENPMARFYEEIEKISGINNNTLFDKEILLNSKTFAEEFNLSEINYYNNTKNKREIRELIKEKKNEEKKNKVKNNMYINISYDNYVTSSQIKDAWENNIAKINDSRCVLKIIMLLYYRIFSYFSNRQKSIEDSMLYDILNDEELHNKLYNYMYKIYKSKY